MMRYGWNGGMQPAFGPEYVISLIANVIIWFLIIFAVIAFIRWMSHEHRFSQGQNPQGDNAIGILKERYAKGELTKKEFEEMKKDIS